MVYEVGDSSPEMKGIVNNNGAFSKYPWSKLTMDTSFFIPLSDGLSKASIQSMASRAGKSLGIKLRVIEHVGKGFEIGCVGMREKSFNKIERTQPTQNANANFAFEPFKPFKNNESE